MKTVNLIPVFSFRKETKIPSPLKNIPYVYEHHNNDAYSHPLASFVCALYIILILSLFGIELTVNSHDSLSLLGVYLRNPFVSEIVHLQYYLGKFYFLF